MKSWKMTLLAAAAALPTASSAAPQIARYDHIFVIIDENHTTDEIVGKSATPEITRYAQEYGFASNFYAIRHPSEPNYVALVGGDTFGINDDDAFYCKPGMKQWGCGKTESSSYVDHTVAGDNLAAQLSAQGLSWKGYFESIPEPGSLVYRWPSAQQPQEGQPDSLYAVKHNGFMTFKSVQDDPHRADKIVGFDALEHDIAAGTLPNFAHIVPNQCNDMHGLGGHDVPSDCTGKRTSGLIGRGDHMVGKLVEEIMHSPVWAAPGNSAIVITFDENDDDVSSSHPIGCCGPATGDPNNPGGGWIPTIVITNHGPRHLDDPTPYNHYSLLRTIEDAFGIRTHLRHAADKDVVSMTPLFAVAHK
jgi:phospholipase C